MGLTLYTKLELYLEKLEDLNKKIKIETDFNADNGIGYVITYDPSDNSIKRVDKDTVINKWHLATDDDVLQQIQYVDEKINFLHSLDSKIIGYLYGGYKNGVSIDKIQRYDTTTETAEDLLTTGNKVAYCPGITLKSTGYFEHDNNHTSSTWYWRKFDFASETLGANISSTLPTRMQVSVYNMGIGDKAMVASGNTQSGASQFQPLSHTNGTWIFNSTNETFTSVSATFNLRLSTRQGANNKAAGFITLAQDNPYSIPVFTFDTDTITISSVTAARAQIPVGLSKDESRGYFIDTATNNRLAYLGNTISSATSISYTFFTQFGESHSLQNYKYGFVMAGYRDTIGEYGGSQHGYCAKMEWSTETTSRLPNIAFPQSSGQMVQR